MGTAERVGVIVWAAFVLLLSASGWPKEVAESDSMKKPEHGYSWRQTDSSLALLNRGLVVWQFNFDGKESRPYFHPVCLADGAALTWHRPPDHPWHYGLWFSWKFINDLNYWEEDPKTGLSQGRTKIEHVEAKPRDDYSAGISMALSYHPPGQQAVVTEQCHISISKPDKNGRYRIDWISEFIAGETDVLFDRTPIPGEKDGKSWGGYAGLSVRIAKDVTKWEVVDGEGRNGLEAHGKKARWMDFSGRSTKGEAAGIAIFDHPDNLRHPSPWFVIMDEKVPFGYFGPAHLFNKPYTLSAGKSLTLRYRIMIHPGREDKNLLEREWKSFLKRIDAQAVIESAKESGPQHRNEQAIHKRLNDPVHVFQFRPDMPFAEAIEEIRHCVEPPLPIAVLWKDLYDNADIDRTTPANIDEISGVSASAALKLLLMSVSGRSDQLGYVIEDGVIIIATVESLPEGWETRVYDVSDLLF